MCPGCGDLNFKRNSACRKCNTPRPENAQDKLTEVLDIQQVQQLQQLQLMQLQQLQAAVAIHQVAVSTPTPASRLGQTVRVANVPASMGVESLHLILTGMFGQVAASSIGVDGTTGLPFALVEFKESVAAAKALQTRTVKFGNDSLEISPSPVVIPMDSSRDRSRSRGRSG